MTTADIDQVRSTTLAAYRPSRAPDLWPPLIAAGIGLLLLVWASGSGFRQDLVVLACVYGLIAVGMYIPFVLAGSLSLAYNAYAAVGAYGVAVVSERSGLPIWLGWLLGAAVVVVIAVVLSLATHRLSGFFLAAVTLLFGIAFETWLLNAEPISGGAAGIGSIRAPSFFGWEPGRMAQVVMAIALVIVVVVLVERIRRSRWGAVVRTMREARLPVEASGVNPTALTTISLAAGAVVASMGGALFATFVGSITPETFTLNVVFLAIFMPLLGGRGTAWGSVVGALLVVQLTVNMSWFQAGGLLLLAVAVLIVLLVAPGGVLGYLDKLRMALLTTVRRGRDG